MVGVRQTGSLPLPIPDRSDECNQVGADNTDGEGRDGAIRPSGSRLIVLSVAPGLVEFADCQLARKRPCISGNHRP